MSSENHPPSSESVPATMDRTKFVGGSDVASILGIDPYRTPLMTYLAKTGQAPAARPDPKGDARKRRGKLWEPIVVAMLAEEYAIEVIGRNHRYVYPAFPYMAAEIDFEWRRADDPPTGVPINGEVKSINPLAAAKWGAPESDDVPMEYAAQSQFGLMVTGRTMCQYAVVFGADDLTLYHVRRDESVIEWMREQVRQFWEDNVLARVPPAPRTLADVSLLWPRDNGKVREAPADVVAMFAAYQRMCRRATLADKAKEALELEIAEWIEDATTATYKGAPVFTYKTTRRKSLAQLELKAALPDVYKQFTRTSESRTLRKPPKEDGGNDESENV